MQQFHFHETIDDEGSVFQLVKDDPIHGEILHSCRDGILVATLCDLLNRFTKVLRSELETAKAQREALAGDLEKYGNHIRGPGQLCELLKSSDFPCTCGFDAILTRIHKGDS